MITVRPFAGTDAGALTGLLHRAYAELGSRGMNFTAVDQTEETTLYRAAGGGCWVATDGPELVATLTVSLPPGRMLTTMTPEAAHPGRAWLNQMAVDPTRRGQGLARRLWQTGRSWAIDQGATAVGVDTAEPASHLIELYRGWGFVAADSIQWPGKTYRSTVMLLSLG